MLAYRPETTNAIETKVTPAYDARVLTGDGNLASVLLDGQVYTLRITKQNKLILTK